ncbi:MAG: DUF4870 domain-containing protein [Dehalococcoidales bacterium]
MGLTPEERKKIYEEEKARLEAREQLDKEKYHSTSETSINLTPNITGVLCYLGIWITGIIFFILEQKNKWIRFHAAQSIVVFGGLGILSAILHWIPFIGWFFTVVIWIAGIVLWVVLLSKAYNGELYKLPLAGDIAEMMVGITIKPSDISPPSPPPPPPTAPPKKSGKASAKAAAPPPPPAAASRIIDEDKKWEDITRDRRERRIPLAAFTIAWSVILLVAFNFFNQYIAYYTYHAATKTWTWEPFFTSDINAWLPILNAALAISIIGSIVIIFVNFKIIIQTIRVITNGFRLASVIVLLVIFPFNFDVIPNSDAAGWTTLGVRLGLVFIAVCLGVSLLVRAIRLLVSVLKTAV